MSQKAIRRTITAAFFAATLALAGTSEAGVFTTTPASEARIEQSLWAQALDWRTSAWGDLVGVSADKTNDGTTTTSGSPTGSSTTTSSSCTNPAGCDAGWGIDPNG
jgi:hypothetical protein